MSDRSRIEVLEEMMERRPGDLRLQFGLALEYLKRDRVEDGVRLLRKYLEEGEDEGNGWGRLGAVLLDQGRTREAREAYGRGVEQARRHGHPTMAAEFEAVLDDLEDG